MAVRLVYQYLNSVFPSGPCVKTFVEYVAVIFICFLSFDRVLGKFL